MGIARNPRLAALRDAASIVGAKIKIEYIGLGHGVYVLYDLSGERLCSEEDTHDMLDALNAYFGSHPRWEDAITEYNSQIVRWEGR